jgi:WD40 repeat protein
VVLPAGHDKALILWDAATGLTIRGLPGHADGVTAAALSPDGRSFVVGTADGVFLRFELLR